MWCDTKRRDHNTDWRFDRGYWTQTLPTEWAVGFCGPLKLSLCQRGEPLFPLPSHPSAMERGREMIRQQLCVWPSIQRGWDVNLRGALSAFMAMLREILSLPPRDTVVAHGRGGEAGVMTSCEGDAGRIETGPPGWQLLVLYFPPVGCLSNRGRCEQLLTFKWQPSIIYQASPLFVWWRHFLLEMSLPFSRWNVVFHLSAFAICT